VVAKFLEATAKQDACDTSPGFCAELQELPKNTDVPLQKAVSVVIFAHFVVMEQNDGPEKDKPEQPKGTIHTGPIETVHQAE